MFVCCECHVLSGRGLCDELITRPEESYRLWRVIVCDLETSRMRRPWPAFGRSATEKKNCIELGHALAWLAEALHYKPEGHRFNSRLCRWNFSLTRSLRPHYGPGVDSATNRNEYQEYFLGDKGSQCIRLTNLPPSCASCLEIGSLNLLEPSGPAQACNGIAFYCT